MTINTENTRWADTASNDSVTGVANRVAPSEGLKSEGLLREEPLSRPHTNYMFNAIHESLLNVQDQIDNLVQGSGASLLGLIYHVGSIYISLDTQSPADKFGLGVWSRIEGRTLIGYDDNDSNFDGIGGTGGASTHSHNQTLSVDNHTLTIAELPSHTHSQTFDWQDNNKSSEGASLAAQKEINAGDVQGSDLRTTNSPGSNQGHSHNISGSITSASNLPPYLVVYMWKRDS